MRWTGHVARKGGISDVYKILVHGSRLRRIILQ